MVQFMQNHELKSDEFLNIFASTIATIIGLSLSANNNNNNNHNDNGNSNDIDNVLTKNKYDCCFE